MAFVVRKGGNYVQNSEAVVLPQTGWWMAWIDGKKEKLAKGKGSKKAAQTKLMQLQLAASRNPDPDSPDQTVASVIEAYLESAGKRLASNTFAMRAPYLQSFAEKHGWRLIADCKPLHMEHWLDSHPEGGATGRRTGPYATSRSPSTGPGRSG